jgi:hypothetical protein
VKDLTGTRAWEYVYRKCLEDRIERWLDALENSEGRDLAGYQYLAGQIRGIRLAIDDLDETQKRFRLDDDNADDD